MRVDTPLGCLSGGLVRLVFGEGDVEEEVGEQLLAYFAGERREFTLPYELKGTPFQRAVWEAALAVPYGECATYGEIAHAIGRPGATRAVGTALGANPLVLIIPCHRIITSCGLGGYHWGEERKLWLLQHEKRPR